MNTKQKELPVGAESNENQIVIEMINRLEKLKDDQTINQLYLYIEGIVPTGTVSIQLAVPSTCNPYEKSQ